MPRCTIWPACWSPGEDPRFIARRLMILASEDIGMAGPSALPTSSAPSSNRCAVPTSMPRCTIWPACWSPGEDP
ncbi:hypothetical protein GR255_28365, partial [Mycobacterium tuberculosis]|nr:hypothetical protein [Mycobacterium tuberculosis]